MWQYVTEQYWHDEKGFVLGTKQKEARQKLFYLLRSKTKRDTPWVKIKINNRTFEKIYCHPSKTATEPYLNRKFCLDIYTLIGPLNHQTKYY